MDSCLRIRKSGMEAAQQAFALQPIWKLCVIRRLVTSRIPLGTGPCPNPFRVN
jgi:hypothetical protein